MKKVSICIISFNSLKYLPYCLEAILNQTYPNIEIITIDNTSTDGSIELLENKYKDKVRLIRNVTNLGYAGGINISIKQAEGEYIMPCNPDLFMTPSFVEEMVKLIEKSKDIGMVQGKFLKLKETKDGFVNTNIIDSTGTYLTRDRRNFDRCQGEEDIGQYGKEEYIFGASGACPLYRREMLEDVAIDGEYCDETFFMYREEVDLNWRAQLFGWKCLYTPKAVAYHLRSYTKETRKKLPLKLRKLQFRNRYLMVYKNDSLDNFLKDLPYILWFDLKAFIYLLVFEPRLLSAYTEVISLLPLLKKKRHYIQNKRRINKKEMRRWVVIS
ncbi:MAG: glycosyltransferase family 2 protein [bacterium]